MFESTETFEDEIKDGIDDAGNTQPDALEQAFEEGLAKTTGDEIKTDESTPAPELIGGVPVDEFKTVFEKAKKFDELEAKYQQLHDKAFGTIGQLKQELNGLKNQQGGSPVTADAFASLTEYFGDGELAEALAKDLTGLKIGGTGGAALDDAKIDEKINGMLDAKTREFETKLLTIQHPDWKQLAAGEEFAAWKNTLSPEAKTTLDETWDGAVLSDAFTKFKDWRVKKAESEQKKQQRLENNMQPKGVSSASGRSSIQGFDDAFNSGVKSVLNSRGL